MCSQFVLNIHKSHWRFPAQHRLTYHSLVQVLLYLAEGMRRSLSSIGKNHTDVCHHKFVAWHGGRSTSVCHECFGTGVVYISNTSTRCGMNHLRVWHDSLLSLIHHPAHTKTFITFRCCYIQCLLLSPSLKHRKLNFHIVLHRYWTWSFILMKIHTLRIYENEVLKIISELKKDKTG